MIVDSWPTASRGIGFLFSRVERRLMLSLWLDRNYYIISRKRKK